MVKFAFALGVVAIAAAPAFACPVVAKANPKVGSIVSAMQNAVSLTFSDPIYPEKSTLHVLDEKGRDFAAGKPVSLNREPDTIAVSLKPLHAGKYTVKWNVYCQCKEYNPGSYPFVVEGRP